MRDEVDTADVGLAQISSAAEEPTSQQQEAQGAEPHDDNSVIKEEGGLTREKGRVRDKNISTRQSHEHSASGGGSLWIVWCTLPSLIFLRNLSKLSRLRLF